MPAYHRESPVVGTYIPPPLPGSLCIIPIPRALILPAIGMVGFKNRYMVMEVFIDPNRDMGKDDPIILSQFNVTKAIKESILANFGECVKYVNPITKICIIRASREDHQKIWCAITMVRTIGNCAVIFNLLDLSGSIRACRNAALKCEEAKFEHYKLVAGDHLTDEIVQHVKNFFEKIKTLEH
ncbi:hypothetical protein Taro_040564 [Colocasia esculenta]|uniref:Uncharacterized protein n=1 Tax=Colocasia esculenta TaxID=4460 RepID=A0A843WYN7_COLES|nr:hypothetical protein [Colocasia esculenta]